MDWLGWVVGIVGTLIGIGGFVFGFRAETRATRKDRREARAEERPPWGDPMFVSGSVWAFRNDGDRTVVVTAIVAERPDWQGLVHPRRDMPAEVGLGDNFPVLLTGTMAGTPAIFIEWHWKGEKEVHRTRRAVK